MVRVACCVFLSPGELVCFDVMRSSYVMVELISRRLRYGPSRFEIVVDVVTRSVKCDFLGQFGVRMVNCVQCRMA